MCLYVLFCFVPAPDTLACIVLFFVLNIVFLYSYASAAHILVNMHDKFLAPLYVESR